jgi:transposase-like protein
VAGRESGEVRLEVVANSDRETLEDGVDRTTLEGATVYTDEWRGCGRLPEMKRGHATVSHAEREWARDDDGDGVREVHDNTLEGIWTGLRNFLRTFRGVSKHYLAQYVAMFQWGYNIKAVTDEFLRTLLGSRPFTKSAS